MAIDITGLDRAAVVQALYAGTRPLGFGALHDVGSLGREQAQAVLDKATHNDGSIYLDYVHGRPLKVCIRGNEIEHEGLYDRDAGAGACARAIASLRRAQPV